MNVNLRRNIKSHSISVDYTNFLPLDFAGEMLRLLLQEKTFNSFSDGTKKMSSKFKTKEIYQLSIDLEIL